MNKKISIGIALALMIVVAAVTFAITMNFATNKFNASITDLENRQVMYSYLSEVDKAVRANYFGTMDEQELRSALAKGYIAGTGDKYARFLSPDQYKLEQDALAGNAFGFGMEVAPSPTGAVMISNVQKDSVAYTSGLQKGDIIKALNSMPLPENPLEYVRQKLSESNSLIVTVTRDGKDVAVEMAPNKYPITSVDSRMIGDIGYIRIRSFNATTAAQFKAAYTSLIDGGAQGIVLDLRNNPGGSLSAAKEIAAFLLPSGRYGYYADKKGKTELTSDSVYQMSVISATIINRNTAGEAELLAAALSQAQMTTLVGEPSAGRSYVQEYFPITADKSAVKLTVGQLFLLDGQTTWEGTGLSPKETVSLSDEQMKRLDVLTDAEDAQLQAALNKLNGTVVTDPGRNAEPSTEPPIETTTPDAEAVPTEPPTETTAP